MKTLLSTQDQKHISTAPQVCGNCQYACNLHGNEAIECRHPDPVVRIGTGRDRTPGFIRNIWDTCNHHIPRPFA